MAPFPYRADQTGRADLPHPASRQTSWQAHGGSTRFVEEEGCDAKSPLDFTPGESAGAPSRFLVPSGEEASNAVVDMMIDRPMSRGAGSVAEVGRPTRQQAVQPTANLLPRRRGSRRRQIADSVFDALHALPRGAYA